MTFSRFVAPSLCALFGLYAVISSIVASSYPLSLRRVAAFEGVLFLLLAFVYVRVIYPREREEIVRSEIR